MTEINSANTHLNLTHTLYLQHTHTDTAGKKQTDDNPRQKTVTTGKGNTQREEDVLSQTLSVCFVVFPSLPSLMRRENLSPEAFFFFLFFFPSGLATKSTVSTAVSKINERKNHFGISASGRSQTYGASFVYKAFIPHTMREISFSLTHTMGENVTH